MGRETRAAGGPATLRHGRGEPVRLVEVSGPERAPVLREYVRLAPGARPFIPVRVDVLPRQTSKPVLTGTRCSWWNPRERPPRGGTLETNARLAAGLAELFVVTGDEPEVAGLHFDLAVGTEGHDILADERKQDDVMASERVE